MESLKFLREDISEKVLITGHMSYYPQRVSLHRSMSQGFLRSGSGWTNRKPKCLLCARELNSCGVDGETG